MVSGTREGDVVRLICRSRHACLSVVVCFLAACAAAPTKAPVYDGQANARHAAKPKTPPSSKDKEPDWRPASYTVKKGDTLYSIALDHGLYYRDLAQWNGLADPNVILVDQTLRLTEPRPTSKPAESVANANLAAPLLRGPKAVKIAYSATALAQLKLAAEPPESAAETKVGGKPAVKAETKAAGKAPQPETASRNNEAEQEKSSNNKITSTSTSTDADDDVDTWQWPTDGKLQQGFGDGGSKGIDVGGKRGQPVYAAAAGKVVYSGSGLRGYGKLLIIKHNRTYLSAYAHNHQLLVKEGEVVKKGDKIAEMGDSDTSQVKLHFEIRRFGKPVDPLKFLPADKS